MSEQYSRFLRGLQQPISCINHEVLNSDNNTGLFKIKGTTNNIYTIIISNIPTCTCIDYKKRKQNCKHIYYILLKFFKAIPSDTYLWESSWDFNTINLLWANYNSQITEKKDAEVVQKCIKENECCICLNDFTDDYKVCYCKYSCGNNFHVKCFKSWEKISMTQNIDLKCPLCRNLWED